MLAALALALLLALAVAASATGFGPSAMAYGKGIAYDCAGGASLAPGSKTKVDWVVWCGLVSGRMRVQVEAPKKASRVRWGGAPRVDGPARRPTCHAKGAELTCRLRKRGPITLRGSFTVSNRACAGRTVVAIRDAPDREGEPFYKEPWGCPGSEPPKPPKLSKILKFRAAEVLDPQLEGDRAAQVAKARRLRRAWIDEAPVERWSQVAWGSPLDATDAELMTLRGQAREQAGGLIEGWVEKHQMIGTYAGWEFTADGSIYIGFTAEQEAIVARMKSQLHFVEPAWVKPFPVPPIHTQSELAALEELIIEYLEEQPDMGTDTLANKLKVGAIKPVEMRKLLTAKFGAEAPIEVVKGEYIHLL